MGQTELFGREATLTIGTIEIKDLRFAFSITATLKPQPNKATIQVFNLNPDHRSQIEQLGTVPVRLDAGYKDGTQTLFLGDLRTCPSMRDGADVVTVVESGDGAKAVQKSRVAISVAKGTNTDKVLRDVATAIGVSAGNLNDAVTKIKTSFPGSGSIFPTGTVLMGSAAREMTNICKSLNLEWSIQQGKLQILERGKALAGEAVLLSKYTGMIDAPTVDNKGVLSVSSLLNPEIFPGRLLVLEGDRLHGQYRIEECEYKGDTRGGDWRVDMKAARY